jgi:hypothetical protein
MQGAAPPSRPRLPRTGSFQAIAEGKVRAAPLNT